MSNIEIYKYPPLLLPQSWRFENYPVTSDIPFVRYILNTLTITVRPSRARFSPPPSRRTHSPAWISPEEAVVHAGHRSMLMRPRDDHPDLRRWSSLA